jgi:hypothetical protein
VIGPAQVQDLFHDFRRRLVRVVVRHTPATAQALVAELKVSGPPQIERRPRYSVVSAGLPDVPDLLGVLDEAPLPLDFSLFGGHSDLLDLPES